MPGSSFDAPIKPRRSIGLAAIAVAALIVLAACDSAAAPSVSPGAPQASRTVVTPTVSPAEVIQVRVPSNAQPLLYGCTAGLPRCEDIPAGTYYTAGEWALLPGLTFTLPSGWSSLANEAGELELHRNGDDHDEILFWRDVVPWHGGHPSLGGVPGPDAWVASLQGNLCLHVSAGEEVVLGDSIDLRDGGKEADLPALAVSVDVAGDALWKIGKCPASGRITIMSDPMHWAGGFNIGGDEMADPGCPCRSVQRFSFASIGYASHPHLLVVALQSFGPDGDVDAAMASLQVASQPILDSLVAPAIVVDN